MSKKVFLWEFVGLIGVIILWAILHISYKNTGIMSLTLFSAVNESIWEHVKIAFFSLFALYVVETFFISRYCKNFWYSKMIGLLVVIITSLIIFYVLSGVNLPFYVVDIIAGIVGFITAQIISYRILISEVNHSQYERVYISMVILLIIPFFIFTFYPIKTDIFKDISTNAYGIFFR
ncbi:DUF6512 family protein [Vallitalea sp.]|jgi:hypothetical protein|uniref:DUF6512 family protein n=1 Tax=Vallitalea sp. TaxID=1882829 RepID=UPI0025D76B32|nr:DUF6512 family protein [Vallitalea sp.]MCT4688731.1 DUF6512 family protein [Vallitalea sp.]